MIKQIIKTGLTGAEKKVAKKFGGVVAKQNKQGEWSARFNKKDVYMPSYGGSIIMTFCGASGATALRAAQELLRVTQLNAEFGRPFMVGSMSDEPERTAMEEDLASKGFKSLRL